MSKYLPKCIKVDTDRYTTETGRAFRSAHLKNKKGTGFSSLVTIVDLGGVNKRRCDLCPQSPVCEFRA